MAYRGIELSASVMCMNFLQVKDQLTIMEDLEIDYLHFDIMDGEFVPEFTMGPCIIKQLVENTKIPSDYHIMVNEPVRIFDQYLFDKDAFFAIHYESCRNLHRELVALSRLGFKPGLVLNPATTLEHIEYVIEEVDLITIMTVNPGYAGQKLVPQVIKKVKKLDDWRRENKQNKIISVDGNVSFEHIPAMVAAGADRLVLGTSSLFNSKGTLSTNYQLLSEAIDQGLELKGKND